VLLNDWQSFFLTKFIPIFQSLGSVMEIVAYIVLFILLPALVYSCKKNIDHCYTELKRQNHLLHSQTQIVSELNIWMQYFDEKMIQRENTPPKKHSEPRILSSVEKNAHPKVITPEKREPLPDNQDPAGLRTAPVSIYKKTI
jgi:hypothetical protein